MRYLNCYLIIPFAVICLFASVLALKANESTTASAVVEIDPDKVEALTGKQSADLTIDHLMAAGLLR